MVEALVGSLWATILVGKAVDAWSDTKATDTVATWRFSSCCWSTSKGKRVSRSITNTRYLCTPDTTPVLQSAHGTRHTTRALLLQSHHIIYCTTFHDVNRRVALPAYTCTADIALAENQKKRRSKRADAVGGASRVYVRVRAHIGAGMTNKCSMMASCVIAGALCMVLRGSLD